VVIEVGPVLTEFPMGRGVLRRALSIITTKTGAGCQRLGWFGLRYSRSVLWHLPCVIRILDAFLLRRRRVLEEETRIHVVSLHHTPSWCMVVNSKYTD
jgi:hypothetical protein